MDSIVAHEAKWETVVDFTEYFEVGVRADELIRRLEEVKLSSLVRS